MLSAVYQLKHLVKYESQPDAPKACEIGARTSFWKEVPDKEFHHLPLKRSTYRRSSQEDLMAEWMHLDQRTFEERLLGHPEG